jgi:hypothetical protein
VLRTNHFSAKSPVLAVTPTSSATYQRGKDTAQKKLNARYCLPDYAGRQQSPRLTGQQQEFLTDYLTQFRDHPGLGSDTTMAAFLQRTQGLRSGPSGPLSVQLLAASHV